MQAEYIFIVSFLYLWVSFISVPKANARAHTWHWQQMNQFCQVFVDKVFGNPQSNTSLPYHYTLAKSDHWISIHNGERWSQCVSLISLDPLESAEEWGRLSSTLTPVNKTIRPTKNKNSIRINWKCFNTFPSFKVEWNLGSFSRKLMLLEFHRGLAWWAIGALQMFAPGTPQPCIF